MKNPATSIKDVFIRKILFPRLFVIDKPGFVTGRYVELLGLGKFTRHVFLSEDFLAELENRLVEKQGEKGAKLLYKCSKIGTWRFATLMGMPSGAKSYSKDAVDALFGFVETMYFQLKSLKADPSKKSLEIRMDETAICRKNGKGYFIPCGAVAGLWGNYLGDKAIEAIQPKCQGRGDKECFVRSAHTSLLGSEAISIPKFTVPLEETKYQKMNKPVSLHGPSLKDMINEYYFKYDSGKLEVWKMRFLPFELGYMYLMEQEARASGVSDVFFKSSFDFYKDLMSKSDAPKPLQFIASFLKATGWGNVTILSGKKMKVVCTNFPWSSLYSKEDDFPIFCGAVSGMLSESEGRNVFLKPTEKQLSDKLTITLTE